MSDLKRVEHWLESALEWLESVALAARPVEAKADAGQLGGPAALSQTDYDNLVRDAMKWRSMDAEHLQYERDEAREKLAAAVSMAEERLAKNEEAARRIAELELALSAETSGLLERAERAEADRDTAKENAAYMLKLYSKECDRSLETEARRDKAESANGRLVAALKVLSKCAKKFQIETDEKKRNGRIWDALYEAIEKADAALAEARKEKV